MPPENRMWQSGWLDPVKSFTDDAALQRVIAQQRQLSQELHDGLGGQILVLAKSSCLPVRLADFKNHVSVDFSPEFTRYEPGTANAADLLHGPL